MNYYKLTTEFAKTVYTCLTYDEALDLQASVGGTIDLQFSV